MSSPNINVELFDRNEFEFYRRMADSEVRDNKYGFFYKNKRIETYSYVTPKDEGVKDFQEFLSFTFSFFGGGEEYIIIKHPLGKYYMKNSKILRSRGFIPFDMGVLVQYWTPTPTSKQKLKPDPSIIIKELTRDSLDIWIEVFYQSFLYPKHLRETLRRMISHQIERDVKFFVGCKNNKSVCCFSSFQIDNIIGLYGVGTAEKYQRQGYATSVMSNFMSDLLERDSSIIFCLQTYKGRPAEKLYTGLGFETAYTQKRFDWDPQSVDCSNL